MTEKTKQELYKELQEKVTAAQNALNEATKFADEHALEFSWSPAYGMGGYYRGKGAETGWQSSQCTDDDFGWQSSSQNC